MLVLEVVTVLNRWWTRNQAIYLNELETQGNLQMKKVSICQTQADTYYSDEDLKLLPLITIIASAMPFVKLSNLQVVFHC